MNAKQQVLKNNLKYFKQGLCDELKQHGNIKNITSKLVLYIDELLITLFNKHQLNEEDNLSLLALGGYGRRELQLYSDVDLLILHSTELTKKQTKKLQHFIQECWDLGLDISHQITTIEACAELASADLTVISSLMDMFLICGHGALMEELAYQIHPLHMWPSKDYFFAKLEEQKKRDLKYGETAYNLEPNIKNGPGGLRDLHILLTISKRHFGVKKLAEGINYGFLTEKEYEKLMHCQHFLWRIRFALHMLAGKAEDRLSFDHQVQLAHLLGYQDKDHFLAIEQLMKDYFKVIKHNRELNEMLLQWFDEAIIHHEKQKIEPLDKNFQLSNQYIEVRHSQVFQNRPEALLELFFWMAKKPEIQGVRAGTVRLIRESLFLINKTFKAKATNTQLFMSLLTQSNVYIALQKMNQYGVLAHYLDCFDQVTGQMQYDLFHAYTVDQHTLFVIRNIERFTQKEFSPQFPLCIQLMAQIAKPELVYLSALFHDIAKGRGGDHSALGAQEAEQFADLHAISKKDKLLVSWIVQNHLLMSQTAQRQDIYDPKTIEAFCALLPDPSYLDYLYLLTVADICGTNPSLWNAWKDSLLKELYKAAKHRMLEEQLLLDEHLLIEDRKKKALELLSPSGKDLKNINSLWSSFKSKYFLHESSEVIARHTRAILETKQFPLVLIMPHHSQGGTEVFIYMPHRDERFTITTAVLSNHHVTIQEALISRCDNAFDLDTYIILDEKNQAFLSENRAAEIQQALYTHLATPDELPVIVDKRLSRALAHFKVKTQVHYSLDPGQEHTCLFLVSQDRPGLLARVSRVLLAQSIHLHNAKIATIGEKVEDVFYVTNQQQEVLSVEEQGELSVKLIEALG